MAGEANFFIYAEVLIALNVAVTQATCDLYAVDHLIDVDLVSEFHPAVNEILRYKLFGAVALRPHAGGINDRGVRFRPHPAGEAGHELSQTVYLALGVSDKARVQMAVETIHMRMTRILPTLVIGIHDVTGIAEARLSGDQDPGAAEENHNYDQQRNPDRPFHLLDNVYR
jgi:hypothetical protein